MPAIAGHVRMVVSWLIIVAALGGVGCRRAAEEPKTLVLATTTSTRDTGLLDVLLPAFEDQTGIVVKAVAVGSGQALELGRRGDADVLLTHSPAAEEKFASDGYADQRRPLMYNDFVLLGPQSDPAKLQSASSLREVFERISQSKSPFVSRGDESGTHVKELQLWKAAAVKPEGDWYIRAGTGMAEALRMADQKNAYTICDRATWLSQKGSLHLGIVYQGDASLKNHYSVIVVGPKASPHVHRQAAVQFADFLFSAAGQRILGQYGVEKFGQQLFFLEPAPAAESRSNR